MRRWGGVVIAVGVLSSLVAGGAHAQVQQSLVVGAHRADRVPGHYIVVLDPGVEVGAAWTQADDQPGVRVEDVYSSSIHGYSASMSAAKAEAMARTPGVRFVQADQRVSATAQVMPTGIDRANADLSPTAGLDHIDRRTNVDVAVLDSGVALNHPDLNVFRPGAHNCVGPGTSAADRNGHGTHVAGIIGALDNRIGVVGMAPGARIWPVRVLNAKGGGRVSQVVCGIDYVTSHANQIEVANMSLGGLGVDDNNCGRTIGDVEHEAICASVAAGVTYVVAAGNDGVDAAQSVPAAYNEVITVSALADFNGTPGGGARPTCLPDRDDTFANFSNFGADVDLIAPGVCIRSTWLHGTYRTESGTSMAAPHVTGAAALYLSAHPAASPAQVRHALIAGGSSQWRAADDPDTIKEPLLDVRGF